MEIIKQRHDAPRRKMNYSDFESGYHPEEARGRGISEREIEKQVFEHTRDVVHSPEQQRKLYDEFYDKNKG